MPDLVAVAPAPAPASIVSPPPPPPPPPIVAAEPPPAPPSAPAPDPEPDLDPIAGTLRAHAGNTLAVELARPPRVGAKGTLERRVSFRSGSIEGWFQLASVTVVKVDGRTVTLAIDKEDTDIVLNGRRVDPFTAGATIRLSPAR